MSQRGVTEQKEALSIELNDARIAVDLTLRELAERIDKRDAIKAELAALSSQGPDSETHEQPDDFMVPWGFCEDDD